MKIIWGGSYLYCQAAGFSSLLLHSVCCNVSLWLKRMRKMNFALSPVLPLWRALQGGILPALSPLSCKLSLQIEMFYSHYLRDQESEVQLNGFAQGHTACRWQNQNPKPGCSATVGARLSPWKAGRPGWRGTGVFLTLWATVSSLVSFSSFPPWTISSNQGLQHHH